MHGEGSPSGPAHHAPQFRDKNRQCTGETPVQSGTSVERTLQQAPPAALVPPNAVVHVPSLHGADEGVAIGPLGSPAQRTRTQREGQEEGDVRRELRGIGGGAPRALTKAVGAGRFCQLGVFVSWAFLSVGALVIGDSCLAHLHRTVETDGVRRGRL
jgi:hypothetical protein